MMFAENFKKLLSRFQPNYDFSSAYIKERDEEVKAFSEMYEQFKKEHGLENLYFSEVVCVRQISPYLLEVYYQITDLYLEYLHENGMYPKEAYCEPVVIREHYFYNSQQEVYFRFSMIEALEKQDELIRKKNVSVHTSSMYEGVTEIIRLSEPSNGLPGMIIDRVPMTREELKDC